MKAISSCNIALDSSRPFGVVLPAMDFQVKKLSVFGVLQWVHFNFLSLICWFSSLSVKAKKTVSTVVKEKITSILRNNINQFKKEEMRKADCVSLCLLSSSRVSHVTLCPCLRLCKPAETVAWFIAQVQFFWLRNIDIACLQQRESCPSVEPAIAPQFISIKVLDYSPIESVVICQTKTSRNTKANPSCAASWKEESRKVEHAKDMYPHINSMSVYSTDTENI